MTDLVPSWTPFGYQLMPRETALRWLSVKRMSKSWCSANGNVTGPMENKISDHYHNCQILRIKKAHPIPSVRGQERKGNVPHAVVRRSKEDSRGLHGRSHPQQQWPRLAQSREPLSSGKPEDVFGDLTFGFTSALFCFSLFFFFGLCLNIHIAKDPNLI